ncbi:hypothetical protein J2S09_003493 [Bacillus fengqiuensis]|nr:hypothetical protein [Bacillus fengqiuensis]
MIILAVLSFREFSHEVYILPLIVNSVVSLMDFFKAFGITIEWIGRPFQTYLPFYNDGAGLFFQLPLLQSQGMQ